MASTARLDELKKKFDENPRRYFAPLANEHRKSGDLEQAIALCRAHLPQQPAHISGHIVMGQALFEAAQLDESRDTFHTALDLDPENLIALRYLGDIARTGGDIPTARSWYQRVLEVDPRNDEIVQLIRDLDAPPAESASSGDGPDQAVTDGSVPSAPQTSVSPPPAAPSADPRFAPLALDQLESDSELFAPTGDADAFQQAASSSVASPWNSQSPTAEMPVLDVPELDPFDMPRTGTAESLFDMGTPGQPSQADALLDELAMPSEPMDIGDLAAAPSDGRDTWASAAAAEPPPSAASEFEDASFYLEPPAAPTTGWTAAPTADPAATVPDATLPASIDVPQPAASHDEAAALDMIWDVEPAASPMASLPNELTPEPELVYPEATVDSQPAQPSYAAPAVSETPQQAAPQGAAAPVDDGLGLEVMEFVPPSRGGEPSSQPSHEADPLVGHMPELTAPASGARPTAFVTETMAELYLQQGFRNEALAVYHELLSRNPDDTSLRDRIQQIESGSMSSLGMAMLSENVVESARKRQTERPTRSVRSFFASLAGRRAPHLQDAQPESVVYYPDAESEATPSTTASAWPAEETGPAASEPHVSSYDAAIDVPDAAPAPAVETSLSAAQQMAAFDPFAETWDVTPPAARTAPNEASNVADPVPLAQAEPPVAFDHPPSEAIPFPTATPEPAAEPRATPRSLEDLFPESSATPRSDAAAQTLATAFGRAEPQGRPTRAASNELSLDRVFRGAPEGAPAQDGGFSFDQFFSDARSASGDAAGASVAPNASDSTRAADSSGDSHDIEQFTAWLEGLKKK